MKPVTPMNKWILDKIANFLRTREGCTVKKEFTDTGMLMEVQDAFGFTYEVKIKTLGRTHENTANMATYPAVSKA